MEKIMLKNFVLGLFISTVFLGCGSPIEDEIEGTIELDEIEVPNIDESSDEDEKTTIQLGLGWRNEQGWEHGRCSMQTGHHVCGFPSPDLGGQSLWRVLANFPIESTTSAVGFNLGTARQYSLNYTNAATANWDFVQSTQGVGSKLIIANDDSIYSGTPPNATISLSSIAHVACTDYGVTLSEGWGAQAFQCDTITVGFDYSSFMAWVNQWATNNNQKQQALNSVYTHFVGTAMGLGSHSAGDSPMRARLSRAQSPITFTSYEICLANSVNFNSPADPTLQINTLGC